MSSRHPCAGQRCVPMQLLHPRFLLLLLRRVGAVVGNPALPQPLRRGLKRRLPRRRHDLGEVQGVGGVATARRRCHRLRRCRRRRRRGCGRPWRSPRFLRRDAWPGDGGQRPQRGGPSRLDAAAVRACATPVPQPWLRDTGVEASPPAKAHRDAVRGSAKRAPQRSGDGGAARRQRRSAAGAAAAQAEAARGQRRGREAGRHARSERTAGRRRVKRRATRRPARKWPVKNTGPSLTGAPRPLSRR
jgi:hypothetical protein